MINTKLAKLYDVKITGNPEDKTLFVSDVLWLNGQVMPANNYKKNNLEYINCSQFEDKGSISLRNIVVQEWTKGEVWIGQNKYMRAEELPANLKDLIIFAKKSN